MEIRLSKLFFVPAPGYAAVLGRRETLLENVPAEFELPAASQNVLNGRVQNGFGSRGFTDFATTLPELSATMCSSVKSTG
jgi:hypothetical protein